MWFIKKIIDMKKSSKRGIFLSVIILFSISLILTPLNGFAEEIDVKSVGLDKTTIITLTNDGSKDVKTFRIWLSQDTNFQSFKTERGWIGEKTPQGVIIFTSSESIKENESVKFGIKTDKANPIINWKGLDQTSSTIDTGVIETTTIESVIENPKIENKENIKNGNGEIFSESTFRIIPDKPNVGSTIRVTGENFEASQYYDFYIDQNKIGNFETDTSGHFMTTMIIPNTEIKDRVDFKVKNNQGEEKIVSLRLGNNENRITDVVNDKISINGIKKVVYRGEELEIAGTATPGTALIVEIKNPEQITINSRTAKVDGAGNWKLDESINIPYDAQFGKYSITVSDGRNQSLKYWEIETDKIILINPTEIMFEPGEIIKFNGTALPNQLIELMLEDNFGNEVISDIINVDDTGFVEFEYRTTENDDEEGTWTLVATQKGSKEFIYVGYGEIPTIPVNLEFNKMNYKASEKAIISFLGKPSTILKMMIINPSGSIASEDISIKLQEDGRATHELDLSNYNSGIYTAVVQKGNSQSSETFSVGLQLGSGPIDAKTTQTEYNQGERILLLGSTNPNVLLEVKLLNPQGIEIKKMDIPSKNDGTFTVDQLKIPSNGATGEWRINVSSGSNLDIIEFKVISKDSKRIGIIVTEDIDIPGFGKNIKISIAANQKTSITMNIVDGNGNLIGDSSTCTPTADFKCEILWTIPKDTIPGTYTIRVNDSIIIEEVDFEIK
ncbi:biofilm-associated protein [Nitrosopumilus sp.]|nr:biofilm-associated protein [Nitrosopumilus sp.]